MLRSILVASILSAEAFTLLPVPARGPIRRSTVFAAEFGFAEQPAAPEPVPEPQAATPAAPESFAQAEARGIELFEAGNYERAIRMFELAQTLPGDGVDFRREKQGGMIGSAFAPPNPREWGERRFATPEQKLIAQYNSARPYPRTVCYLPTRTPAIHDPPVVRAHSRLLLRGHGRPSARSGGAACILVDGRGAAESSQRDAGGRRSGLSARRAPRHPR